MLVVRMYIILFYTIIKNAELSLAESGSWDHSYPSSVFTKYSYSLRIYIDFWLADVHAAYRPLPQHGTWTSKHS